MAKVSDGAALFDRTGDIGRGNSLLAAVPTSNATANAALRTFWTGKPHTDQYDWDVAAWYGALTMPGHNSIAACLVKLFAVLRNAGVYYDDSNRSGIYDWKDCSVAAANMPNGIPLGAILAHGGRLLIQLPVRTEHDDQGSDFFNWLTEEARAGGTCLSRTTATHAMAHRAPALTLPAAGRKIRTEEKRGKTSGIRGAIKTKIMKEENHWGVNLALFGSGRTNWFSGNPVNHNGGHGHLYIYFNPKDVGQCAGMMVGGENSGVGAMSQTFVGHGAKAVSEDFSPAGTYKWPTMNHGPHHMIEEFLVDLTDGWTWLRGMEMQFDPAWLDHTTLPVGAARTDDALRCVIYAVVDLLDNPPGNVGFFAKRRLEDHKKTLLTARALPRATLSAIMKECLEAYGLQNVVINIDGSYSAGNVVTVAVPLALQNTIATCRTNWNISV